MSRVKQARLNRGYSLDQAARLADITSGYLSQIENGQRSVSVERAEVIANMYNYKLEELFKATRFTRRETVK